jgi:uncharacterized protein (TIGR02145 family)
MRHTYTLTLAILLAVVFSACKEDENIAPVNSVTIEGTEYPTVEIGTQTWTSVNYAGPGGVSFDAIGSMPEYGKYYSRVELEAIKVPEGWRIPTMDDYKKLAEFYSMPLPTMTMHSDLIKPLISATHWNHVVGTNTSGFNAYPGGYMFGSAPPIDGDIAEFWASGGITLSIQEAGENLSKLRMALYQSDNSPDYKFNVRFVKAD